MTVPREKTPPPYRADIDGLRAVAVLAVLLFHLHAPGFGGGYVGVDVFFVISGYLITTILLREIDTDSFTFKKFYTRRIRRLAPALLVVAAATTAASFFLLYPQDMRSFAKSMLVQFLSLQNFSFFAEGEYFRGSDTKPMLHTWSLAVEEQFYIFWPIFLLLIRRHSFTRRLVAIHTIILASFLLNLVLMRLSPKASFFLLPPRVWELGAGGLLAFLEVEGALRGRIGKGLSRACLVLGGALILGATFLFRASTPFPGFAALAPVLGAFLVLLAGCGEASPLTALLSSRPLVRVGLVSYPLYLWHWPLIVFSIHLGWDITRPGLAAGILAGSYVLAEFTYLFLENPIRHRRIFSADRHLVLATMGLCAVLVAAALQSYLTEGAAWRYSPEGKALLTAPFHASSDRCGLMFRALHPRGEVCPLLSRSSPSRRVLIWGNSHADMWSSMLKALGEKHSAEVFLNAKNCRSTRDHSFCGAAVQDSVLRAISSNKITDVILASTWHGSYDIPDPTFEEELRAVVKKIAGTGARIWLVVDVPADDALNPILTFQKNPNSPRLGTSPRSRHDAVWGQQKRLFESLSVVAPVRIIDPSPAFCDAQVCRGGTGTEIWYRDSNHVTFAGAAAAAVYFEEIFRSLLPSTSLREHDIRQQRVPQLRGRDLVVVAVVEVGVIKQEGERSTLDLLHPGEVAILAAGNLVGGHVVLVCDQSDGLGKRHGEPAGLAPRDGDLGGRQVLPGAIPEVHRVGGGCTFFLEEPDRRDSPGDGCLELDPQVDVLGRRAFDASGLRRREDAGEAFPAGACLACADLAASTTVLRVRGAVHLAAGGGLPVAVKEGPLAGQLAGAVLAGGGTVGAPLADGAAGAAIGRVGLAVRLAAGGGLPVAVKKGPLAGQLATSVAAQRVAVGAPLADGAAGAAISHVGLAVRLAAGGGLPVAVKEGPLAGQLAGAVLADRFRVALAADLPASPAIGLVLGDVGLAAVAGLTITIQEPLRTPTGPRVPCGAAVAACAAIATDTGVPGDPCGAAIAAGATVAAHPRIPRRTAVAARATGAAVAADSSVPRRTAVATLPCNPCGAAVAACAAIATDTGVPGAPCPGAPCPGGPSWIRAAGPSLPGSSGYTSLSGTPGPSAVSAGPPGG